MKNVSLGIMVCGLRQIDGVFVYIASVNIINIFNSEFLSV